MGEGGFEIASGLIGDIAGDRLAWIVQGIEGMHTRLEILREDENSNLSAIGLNAAMAGENVRTGEGLVATSH